MPISSRVQQNMAQGGWILKMSNEGVALKQKYGSENVFDLTIGNPVMEPPVEFHQELKRLAENPVPGMHRYMQIPGYVETREAVAQQLARDTGIRFTRNDVVMTCGTAGAANVVLKTILNPGDEVIVFSPYFPEYLFYIDNYDAVAKVLPSDERFIPRLDTLEAAISARTKALIINSPNNPSGAVYSEGLLRQLGQLLEQKEAQYGRPIFLISDEVYRKIIYDGLHYSSPLLHYRQSFMITSHSKDLALPGERIGYIAVHPDCSLRREIIGGLVYCNRTMGYVCAPALMQRIVARLQAVTVSVAKYQQQRDFLSDSLSEMGYNMIKPQGAFYLFPQTPIADDVAFTMALLKLRVLAVPGVDFGVPGHIRLSYCVDDRTLSGSLDGFRKAAQQFSTA